VLNARTSLVPGLGLVPAEVECARIIEDFQRMARQIVLVMERRGVPLEVQQEVVDTVEGRLPRCRSQPTANLRMRLQLPVLMLSSRWLLPLRLAASCPAHGGCERG